MQLDSLVDFTYGRCDVIPVLCDSKEATRMGRFRSSFNFVHSYCDLVFLLQVLVKLLENVEEDESVLSNVVGALWECLKFDHNRSTLRKAEGIPHLVNLLNYTYPPLLENVPMVLRACAEDRTPCVSLKNWTEFA